MLFGDAIDNNVVASSAAAFSCLLAAITGLFSWLSGRDKLKYDARMVGMEAKIQVLTEKTEELRAETAECHDEREKQAKEIRELRNRLDDQSKTHKSV